MNCPKCGKPFTEIRISSGRSLANYIEVEATCQDDHLYFARIKEQDLIDTDLS